MSVLVVAAHPDDEVLGCGGTVARLADQGERVYIAILGEGVTSRYESREEVAQAELSALQGKARTAAEILGASDLFMYDFPDNQFDSIPLISLIKSVEDLIRRLAPKTIFTHFHGDLNVDHTQTFRAVLTACRPMAGTCVKELYSFEIPSSTEWAFGQMGGAFVPNVFFDVSGYLNRKTAAMQTYESEKREFPHPRSPESLTALAQKWGSASGLAAAESYMTIFSIR